MGTLHCITIDCADPARLSKFWAQALDGYADDPSGLVVRSESGPMMYFQKVPEGKSAKNRVHIDIASSDRAGEVRRLVVLGAFVMREMESLTVMQDPEGDEFCVTEAAAGQPSGEGRLKDIVFDCAKPARVARFWAAALDDYAIRPYDDEEIARLREMGITDLEDDPGVANDSSTGGPTIFFQTVPEPKTVKNRLHIDLGASDVQTEVDRLSALGGTVIREMSEGSMQ
jgi:predicted enzyme related to lactoylglutathione lyase